MSHLDPYGSIEPRGRDRTAALPAGLPWPDRELEPGGRVRHAYADQSTTTWSPQRYDDTPDDQPTLVPGHPDFERAWADPVSPADSDPPPTVPQPVGVDPRPAGTDPYPVGSDPYPVEGGARPVGAGLSPEVGEPEPTRPPGRWHGRRRPVRGGGSSAGHGRPSRAGRNLPAAIAVGLALGGLIVGSLFFVLEAFLVVLAGAVAIGIGEMVRAVRRADAHSPMTPLIAGGVITVGVAWFSGPDALMLGLLVTLGATALWRLADGLTNLGRDLVAAMLIAVYVPFLAGFAALLAAAPGDGHLRVLVTLVAVVLSDTGGYAAGANFGRHAMAPTISPKKSWEGFVGSVVAAASGSALLLWLLFDVAPWWGALFGVAVSVAAVLGDLGESMIKRDLGIKDMSNLLPGHGGLMDRLDSILFAVPTAYLLLAVFAPVVG
ncbi:phosphatidate cytidylyltransferase [Micromonospora sp. WMMD882]|uniref:phosphatidate cytidylyltransferase n=1 Tax=Micromonospora sp. WMMD882 TaxID=3015151 RepID=UPI00248C85AD|nr:phosphatidate cytidylyltransferase [Micromonospora sp. WMMD882]WBB81924.1 phosphatidate cytidylyltransferase [Micromonospora sp. WMMD882]